MHDVPMLAVMRFVGMHYVVCYACQGLRNDTGRQDAASCMDSQAVTEGTLG
jgi:hypothetical protein